MSALSTLGGILKTVAPSALNLVLPGTGSVLSGILDATMPGSETTDEEKAAAVLADPTLLAEVKKKALEVEAEIAKQKTEMVKSVNTTMQAELQSGRWYQRAWRPFNGFLFPITIIGNYLVLPLIVPQTLFSVLPEVPWELWVVWGGILGVTSYGRNQEKKAAAGGSTGGLISGIISAFKK
jgi:hypothetical protein